MFLFGVFLEEFWLFGIRAFSCTKRSISHDFFIAMEAVWVPTGLEILVITVYTPQDINFKKRVWSSIILLIEATEAKVILMGDFNEVWDALERYGSQFCTISTRVFNQFILDAGLIEVPLRGPQFTWSRILRIPNQVNLIGF